MEIGTTAAQWREVIGSQYAMLRFRHAIKTQYHMVVSPKTIWVLVPDDRREEYDLLQGEQDTLSSTPILRPPESVQAPCGQYVIATSGISRHKGRCVECRKMAGLLPARANAVTLVSVPEMAGTAMDLDALMLCIAVTRDEALNLAEQLDVVINSVKEMPQLNADMAALKAKMITYQQALGYFLNNAEV